MSGFAFALAARSGLLETSLNHHPRNPRNGPQRDRSSRHAYCSRPRTSGMEAVVTKMKNSQSTAWPETSARCVKATLADCLHLLRGPLVAATAIAVVYCLHRLDEIVNGGAEVRIYAKEGRSV